MARVLLIRHARHDVVDEILAGRTLDIGLSAQGQAQAEALALRLAAEPIGALHSSPRRRCHETATHLARHWGLTITPAEALDEIDFGDWSGRRFCDLESDPRWRRWNRERSLGRAPNGESATGAQARLLEHLAGAALRMGDSTLAVVSHAELIRSALLFARGWPLDDWHKIAVPTASVFALHIEAGAIRPAEEEDIAGA